jgi:hypothetical protein
MDDAWDVTEDGEEDVDEEVAATPTLEEYTKRWQDDGDDDFADIATPGNLSIVISQARRKAGIAELELDQGQDCAVVVPQGGVTYEAVKGMLTD